MKGQLERYIVAISEWNLVQLNCFHRKIQFYSNLFFFLCYSILCIFWCTIILYLFACVKWWIKTIDTRLNSKRELKKISLILFHSFKWISFWRQLFFWFILPFHSISSLYLFWLFFLLFYLFLSMVVILCGWYCIVCGHIDKNTKSTSKFIALEKSVYHWK